MKKLNIIFALFLFLSNPVFADWMEEVNGIHAEIQALTVNQQSLGDTQRLERFFQLSYDLVMLEYPGFATGIGDPRGQDRLEDLSEEGIMRRQKAERDALALMESIERDALSEENRVNYDLLRDRLKSDVRGQQFPGHYLQMNQMGGPQQDIASLLAMMPNARAGDLENQLARIEALPVYLDQSIALMRKGLEAGVTPPAITLRDVPQQIRNQLVDDAADSPLLTGFVDIPDTVDPLQAETLRKRAASVFSQQVVPAYERLLEFTENEYLPGARESIAMCDLPEGPEWYRHNVAVRTTTDLSPQKIHDIGLQEVKRIRAEMNELIKSIGFEGSFEEFLHFLRTDPQFYHTSAADLMREYRDIAKRADPELTRLFGHLPRTPYGVIEVPSYAEESTTTAYYQRGSLKAGRPGLLLRQHLCTGYPSALGNGGADPARGRTGPPPADFDPAGAGKRAVVSPEPILYCFHRGLGPLFRKSG